MVEIFKGGAITRRDGMRVVITGSEADEINQKYKATVVAQRELEENSSRNRINGFWRYWWWFII